MTSARDIEPTAHPRNLRPAPTSDPHGADSARLFITDVRIAWMLVNEARYRAFGLIGVRREDVNIATVVAAGMLADSAHRRLSRMMRMAKRPPAGDIVLAGGTAGELLRELGGPSSREVQFYGALIVLAVATTRAGPVMRESIDGIASLSRATMKSFHRNFGYLLGREPDTRPGR